VLPPLLVTLRLIAVACVCPPPAPVITTLQAPGAAAPAEIVSVAEPAPGAAIELGVKLANAPAGRPDTESETPALKPPESVVVIVVPADAFCAIVSAGGDAEMLKLSVVAGGVAFSVKSSSTNDAFRLAFSTPTKKI